MADIVEKPLQGDEPLAKPGLTPHRKLALSGLRDRVLLGVLVYNGTAGWIVTCGSVPVGLTPLWRALAARTSSPSRDP